MNSLYSSISKQQTTQSKNGKIKIEHFSKEYGHRAHENILNIANYYFCCCSVTKLYQTLCDPMNQSMPGFSVLHYLLEFAQKFMSVETLMLSNHLSSAASFSFCLQSFLAPESFPMSWLLHQVAKVLELQEQSFQ